MLLEARRLPARPPRPGPDSEGPRVHPKKSVHTPWGTTRVLYSLHIESCTQAHTLTYTHPCRPRAEAAPPPAALLVNRGSVHAPPRCPCTPRAHTPARLLVVPVHSGRPLGRSSEFRAAPQARGHPWTLAVSPGSDIMHGSLQSLLSQSDPGWPGRLGRERWHPRPPAPLHCPPAGLGAAATGQCWPDGPTRLRPATPTAGAPGLQLPGRGQEAHPPAAGLG